MEFISKASTAVKDGYLAAIDWIEDHPHLTFWAALCLLIVALVF